MTVETCEATGTLQIRFNYIIILLLKLCAVYTWCYML